MQRSRGIEPGARHRRESRSAIGIGVTIKLGDADSARQSRALCCTSAPPLVPSAEQLPRGQCAGERCGLLSKGAANSAGTSMRRNLRHPARRATRNDLLRGRDPPHTATRDYRAHGEVELAPSDGLPGLLISARNAWIAIQMKPAPRSNPPDGIFAAGQGPRRRACRALSAIRRPRPGPFSGGLPPRLWARPRHPPAIPSAHRRAPRA